MLLNGLVASGSAGRLVGPPSRLTTPQVPSMVWPRIGLNSVQPEWWYGWRQCWKPDPSAPGTSMLSWNFGPPLGMTGIWICELPFVDPPFTGLPAIMYPTALGRRRPELFPFSKPSDTSAAIACVQACASSVP